jgi:hypothetical protein
MKRLLPALIVLAAASTYPLARWITTPGPCRQAIYFSGYHHDTSVTCPHKDQVLTRENFTNGGGAITCTCPHK